MYSSKARILRRTGKSGGPALWPPGRREALWRYHESLTRAASGPLWRIGRSAAAESENDPLGDEYRALTVPTLYYWSQESTTPDTRLHLERHGVRNVGFAGGHWPMVEEPEATASRIAAFFDPLFSTAGVR